MDLKLGSAAEWSPKDCPLRVSRGMADEVCNELAIEIYRQVPESVESFRDSSPIPKRKRYKVLKTEGFKRTRECGLVGKRSSWGLVRLDGVDLHQSRPQPGLGPPLVVGTWENQNRTVLIG
jgi:hypothetical protein